MKPDVYYVQTFTGKNAAGGPTAVCLLAAAPGKAGMLRMARSTQVAVTAFLFPGDNGAGYNIRYCTPVMEIAACGHATLAAAQLIFKITGHNNIVFAAPQGLLTVYREADGRIRMRYPKYETAPFLATDALLQALGLDFCISPDYCSMLQSLFIEVEPAVLRSMQPDFVRLQNSNHVIKEVVVTAVSDTPEYDYLFRSFCPWMGMNEDTATGSVHGVLAHYWSRRLRKKTMQAYQASQAGALMYVTAGQCATMVAGYAGIINKNILTVTEYEDQHIYC